MFSASKEFIYFISDPPHLIKTIRNCFASSKRNLWVSLTIMPMFISKHGDCYSVRGEKSAGGTLLTSMIWIWEQEKAFAWSPKSSMNMCSWILFRRWEWTLQLRYVFHTTLQVVHTLLTGFIWLQVLSNTVGEALCLTGGSSAFETAYFIKKVDKFFDCLNVKYYDQGKKNRKEFQQPYRSEKDFRLDVSGCIVITITGTNIDLFQVSEQRISAVLWDVEGKCSMQARIWRCREK